MTKPTSKRVPASPGGRRSADGAPPRDRVNGAPSSAPAAPTARSAEAKKPTPPRRFKSGPKRQPPAEILITSFRAEGSIRGFAEQIYGGVVMGDPGHARKAERYASIQTNYPRKNGVGYPQSPGVWTSVEGFVLGQVNFQGKVRLQTLFDMLNKALALDFVEESRSRNVMRKGKDGKTRTVRESYTVERRLRSPADFRRVYPNWKWKYQIVRVLIVPQYRQKEFKTSLPDGKDRRVILSKSGASR